MEPILERKRSRWEHFMNGHLNCVALLKTVFSKFLFVLSFICAYVPKPRLCWDCYNCHFSPSGFIVNKGTLAPTDSLWNIIYLKIAASSESFFIVFHFVILLLRNLHKGRIELSMSSLVSLFIPPWKSGALLIAAQMGGREAIMIKTVMGMWQTAGCLCVSELLLRT